MKKKGLNFPFLIITLIIGNGIYREFDFKTNTFDNVYITIVYIITFLFGVFIIIKQYN